MFDGELALETVRQLLYHVSLIQQRSIGAQSSEDFLGSDQGLPLLDAICMQFIALGEGVKNLDKLTNRTLLVQYRDVPWQDIMGMRDVLSHHYIHLDAEVVFKTCKEGIPVLEDALNKLEASMLNSRNWD